VDDRCTPERYCGVQKGSANAESQLRGTESTLGSVVIATRAAKVMLTTHIGMYGNFVSLRL
jgi:hypothetical protein